MSTRVQQLTRGTVSLRVSFFLEGGFILLFAAVLTLTIGLEAIRALSHRFPNVPPVIFTMVIGLGMVGGLAWLGYFLSPVV